MNAGLSLTSMIDFLVVTVVFLLMTFSASGETPVAKGLNLPKAENTLDMIDAPIVAVVRQPDPRRRRGPPGTRARSKSRSACSASTSSSTS